ncbi:MAG TPA: signal recognition particle-docking protein FtsY [Burkholderiaceae bacterium]|nr:signal recognition particle-docking protein FtsY [Burkholderiaceae bacterium]
MFSFLKKKNVPRPGGEDQAADPAAPGAPTGDDAAAGTRAAESDSSGSEHARAPSEDTAAPELSGAHAAADGSTGSVSDAHDMALSQPVVPPETSAAVAAPAAGKSWLSRLRSGLSRTGQSIGGLFVGVKVDEALFEELETALIMADAGVAATEQLLTALRARVRKERLSDASQVRLALRDILAEHLAPLEKSFPLGSVAPLIVMIAGVNGAGKTTSIGKLANAFQRQGASVLLAAGDTFRAAAREQLMAWGARNNVTVIAQEGGDPAAVAFDAVNAGRAREAGVVMIDTAGRLPTQLHLMEELKKIRRVIGKADAAAPHEVLLVIDGNTGQNAISQIKAFDAAINLTGLVVTKLDGTAKGGALAAVAAGSQGVRPVPVYWIGVGEGLDDLQPFVAREFATALVGEEP